jgi:hypothetical protein
MTPELSANRKLPRGHLACQLAKHRVSYNATPCQAWGPPGGRGTAERNLSWPGHFCILRWSDRQRK